MSRNTLFNLTMTSLLLLGTAAANADTEPVSTRESDPATRVDAVQRVGGYIGNEAPPSLGNEGDPKAAPGSAGSGGNLGNEAPPSLDDWNGKRDLKHPTAAGSSLDDEAPEQACRADIDGDGVIGFLDLLAVLNQWGGCPLVDHGFGNEYDFDACKADTNYTGSIDFDDFIAVLSSYGRKCGQIQGGTGQ